MKAQMPCCPQSEDRFSVQLWRDAIAELVVAAEFRVTILRRAFTERWENTVLIGLPPPPELEAQYLELRYWVWRLESLRRNPWVLSASIRVGPAVALLSFEAQ